MLDSFSPGYVYLLSGCWLIISWSDKFVRQRASPCDSSVGWKFQLAYTLLHRLPQSHAIPKLRGTFMDEPTQATQSQTWTDGQGRSWQIDADPELVILSRDGDSDERVEIPQSDWRRSISFAPSGTRVVIHFDTGMQEIGFLVPMDEARSLFAAMKQPAPILLPSVAPQKSVEHAPQSTR